MATNKSKTKEEVLAHLTYKQVVITSVIGAISTIFITLMSSGYWREDNGELEKQNDLAKIGKTYVHTEPIDVAFWNDAKDEYIWFNAQYKNASTVHDESHYNLIKQEQIKFTLILIQPNKDYKNDFINFEGKFHDMRKFLKKTKAFGDREGFDISRYFPNIYVFKEGKIPSISFFLTKNKKNIYKGIFYIEEKYFMDENRKPILCLETTDQSLINKFEARYKELLNNSKAMNRLNYSDLISELPDSTFYLK